MIREWRLKRGASQNDNHYTVFLRAGGDGGRHREGDEERQMREGGWQVRPKDDTCQANRVSTRTARPGKAAQGLILVSVSAEVPDDLLARPAVRR